jgi:SAM-dependent methyltransferase
MSDDVFETNRRNWDDRAVIHIANRTGFYGVDSLRAGDDALHPIEDAELGDVRGLRLCHLQCHFGLDSIRLARRGADVVGLDFSGPAIAKATELARELGVGACFVEGNVYDARRLIDGAFDLVFTSWGTICWLPDIGRWGQVVASLLAPGGAFYMADMHPCFAPLEQKDGKLVIEWDWGTPPDKPLVFEDATTYNGDPTPLANPRTYQWIHPLGSVTSALIDAGLRLEFLHEHETLPWQGLPLLVEHGRGMYRLPAGHPRLPLSFSLRARKDGR